MIRPVVHILLHFAAPALLARVAYAQRWRFAWLVMAATIIVDLDHLLAIPLYDPNRCSMGFHPLHTWPMVASYGLLLMVPRVRLVALGLVLHMALDTVDCIWMGTLPVLLPV